MAPAFEEVVLSPVCSATMRTAWPRSRNVTAVVSPTIPAPMTVTRAIKR